LVAAAITRVQGTARYKGWAWRPGYEARYMYSDSRRGSHFYHGLGLSLLFPKYYLIFHSEFPKLLLYYSLRVDPLFHKILLTVSQK